MCDPNVRLARTLHVGRTNPAGESGGGDSLLGWVGDRKILEDVAQEGKGGKGWEKKSSQSKGGDGKGGDGKGRGDKGKGKGKVKNPEGKKGKGKERWAFSEEADETKGKEKGKGKDGKGKSKGKEFLRGLGTGKKAEEAQSAIPLPADAGDVEFKKSSSGCSGWVGRALLKGASVCRNTIVSQGFWFTAHILSGFFFDVFVPGRKIPARPPLGDSAMPQTPAAGGIGPHGAVVPSTPAGFVGAMPRTPVGPNAGVAPRTPSGLPTGMGVPRTPFFAEGVAMPRTPSGPQASSWPQTRANLLPFHSSAFVHLLVLFHVVS